MARRQAFDATRGKVEAAKHHKGSFRLSDLSQADAPDYCPSGRAEGN